jgi:uridine phosphorylase
VSEVNLTGKDHLGLRVGAVPPTVLLPGDPDRVAEIAALWDSHEAVGERREFRTYTGKYRGADIAACSSGIGGPSAEIAVVELYHHGARNLIRVGTCGGLHPDVRPGDLVVLTGCARLTGAADAYAPPGYPALAHHEVVRALIDSCRSLGHPCHVGLGLTVDAFYATKPYLIRREAGPVPTVLEHELERWRDLGILQVEMESAAVFVIGSILGMKAGAICTAGSAVFRKERPGQAPSNRPAIEAACLAARLLAGERGGEGAP